MVVEPCLGCCNPTQGGKYHEGSGVGEVREARSRWHRWDETESYFCPMGSGGGVLWQWDSQLLRHETCQREKVPPAWETLTFICLYFSSVFFWKLKKKMQNFAFCLLLSLSFANGFLKDFWFDNICRLTQPLTCFIHTLYLHPMPHQSDPWRHWSVWLWNELPGLRIHQVVMIK